MSDGGRAVAAMHAAVDALLELDLEAVADLDVLALWRDLESVSNRLAAVDHRVLQRVATGDALELTGATSLTTLARQVLRVGAGEARSRVAAAESCGPRRALSGEPLGPVFEHVAAAQRDGAIGAAAARTVVTTVDGLPDAVAADVGESVEAMLVERAREWDADTLAKHARDVATALDPDGALRDADERERRRELHVRPRPDGSARLSGELTAECAEHVRTVLEAFAAPRPDAEGGHDPRTRPQRLHDALLETCKLAERSGHLPRSGGVTTTVVLVVSAERDWVRTSHGVSVPLSEALGWLDGECRLVTVALDRLGAVSGYGSAHRIFTENQRFAFTVRDGGCIFPGCDAPAARCETHHVREYADGGPTSTDNGVLLCRYHHRHFARLGWHLQIEDGRPSWIPPPWIDPTRAPRTNHMHHREPVPV